MASTLSSAKKRKEAPSPTDHVSKKKSKKVKHRARDDPSTPVIVKRKKKKHTANEESEFMLVRASLMVSIPPIFSSNPRAGVEEMLDSMVMRYIASLQGVVLTHSNLKFVQNYAIVQYDCPFARCTVEFDAMLWCPKIGMKLSAQVNLFSPDHISLLIHRTFNVSIPRNHIPLDHFAFEYGPAENDPESHFRSPSKGTEHTDLDGVPLEPSVAAEPSIAGEPSVAVDSVGRWTRRITGYTIGGDAGRVEFTVIGLTIANQMLSLIGSLQPDPFNPEHAARAPSLAPESTIQQSEESIQEHDFDQEVANDSPEEDAFDSLARLREGAAEAAQRRRDEEKEEKRQKALLKAQKKLEKLTVADDPKSEPPSTPAPAVKKRSKNKKAVPE